MESSIKVEKIKSMKKYKRVHQFLYNLVLYSLTSLITLLFFTYPFWFPSMKNFLFSFPNNISFFFNAKCLFILGNIIIFVLVGESRLTQPRSSPASEIYDEYVARSRKLRCMNSNTNIIAIKYEEDEFVQKLEENLQYEVKKKKVVRVSKGMHQNEEKKRGIRASKSEVWGESGIVKSEGIEENLNHEGKKKKDMRVCKSMHQHGEKKRVLRASKSEVWGENEILKRVGNEDNLHHEEKNDMRVCKSMHQHEEKIMGLRVSKSEVWGENEIVKTEHVENLHHREEKKKEMRVSKSMNQHNQEKKGGLRASKSEVWGESTIVLRERAKEKKAEELYMPTEELNTRVEAFIARVNKQRLFEAKLLQEG